VHGSCFSHSKIEENPQSNKLFLNSFTAEVVLNCDCYNLNELMTRRKRLIEHVNKEHEIYDLTHEV